MNKTTFSTKLAAKTAAVASISALGLTAFGQTIANAQTENQPQSDASWLWWLLPLAALAILFFVLRRSLQMQRDNYDQFNFDDSQPLAGVKGGKVTRNRDAEEEDEDLDIPEDRKNRAEPWDRSKDDWNL